jgi:hypothetical protein
MVMHHIGLAKTQGNTYFVAKKEDLSPLQDACPLKMRFLSQTSRYKKAKKLMANHTFMSSYVHVLHVNVYTCTEVTETETLHLFLYMQTNRKFVLFQCWVAGETTSTDRTSLPGRTILEKRFSSFSKTLRGC